MHVRVIVIHDGRIALVQHYDSRDRVSYWLPPGGGSEPGETAEAAAIREVCEETGLKIRIRAALPVPPERGYICFLAEVVGGTTITPEIETPNDGIYGIGAAWHRVSVQAPLGVLEPGYWSELAEPIRAELQRQASRQDRRSR